MWTDVVAWATHAHTIPRIKPNVTRNQRGVSEIAARPSCNESETEHEARIRSSRSCKFRDSRDSKMRMESGGCGTLQFRNFSSAANVRFAPCRISSNAEESLAGHFRRESGPRAYIYMCAFIGRIANCTYVKFACRSFASVSGAVARLPQCSRSSLSRPPSPAATVASPGSSADLRTKDHAGFSD